MTTDSRVPCVCIPVVMFTALTVMGVLYRMIMLARDVFRCAVHITITVMMPHSATLMCIAMWMVHTPVMRVTPISMRMDTGMVASSCAVHIANQVRNMHS